MTPCWPTSTRPSRNGNAPFVDAALAANLNEPSTLQQILWAGARAIGLHPWHPEVQQLNLVQLHWAILQGNPGRREEVKKAKAEHFGQQAAELIAWNDTHVSD